MSFEPERRTDFPGARTALSALLWLAGLCAGGAIAQEANPAKPTLAPFELRDFLGREWQNEIVFFNVDAAVFGRSDVVLLTVNKQSVPFQWSTNDGKQIVFLASVSRFGKADYTLSQGKPKTDAPLVLSKQRDVWKLANGKTGIRLHSGKLALEHGPIAGVRLTSGKWVGSGELRLPTPPTDFQIKVLADGPVFTEVETSYKFSGDNFWRLRFRVMAGEPVVLVDEQFSGPAGAEYRFKAGAGFDPDHIFWRKGTDVGTAALSEVASATVFRLEPWVQWWRARQGNWMALYRDDEPDSLAIGLREAAAWVTPGKTDWDTGIEMAKADLCLKFPLRGFERKWMFVTLPKADALRSNPNAAPLPQQFVIKHGDAPLNRIKSYVLEWPDTGVQHPRLFVSKAELEKFRASFKVNESELNRLRQTTPGIYDFEDHVAYLLATGDSELRSRVSRFALEQLQVTVDLYVRQAALATQGVDAPRHYDQVTPTLNALDAVLAPGVLSAEERARVRAQLAYLGYTLANPSVWSPERGFNANPNMTTMMRCMLGVLACLIPDHPMAKEWAQIAIREMDEELRTWTGSNGGWRESPHYSTVSLSAIAPLALALRQSTFTSTNWTTHPGLKGAIRWLAAISTPPDPRLNGQRHLPEIGNSYLGERTGLTGWLARFWRERDPVFAGEMQWAWRAQGSFERPGLGGAYPGVAGFSRWMFDETIPANPPTGKSEWFPECGVVMRAHFPGNCETYLHYIFGGLHDHYDVDHGSFILWGKGKPLCEDFGYYGEAPAADHSRVDRGHERGSRAGGEVREFFASERADYLHSELQGWHRQILFVKDADCLGPNYFVVRDTVANNAPADWRVWLATDATPDIDAAKPIRVAGRYGVDLVVYFAETSGGKLSTEFASRTNGASGFQSLLSEQRSLRLKLKTNATVTAVLYPVTKDQAVPKFETQEGGRVVKIETAFGTDYVFLGRDEFAFKQGDISFKGRSGAIQIRGDGIKLSLPTVGGLTYKGQTLVKTAPVPVRPGRS